MQYEKDILKWLNGELSETELKEFQKTEDYSNLSPIMDKMAMFKKPGFNPQEGLEQFNALKENKEKTIPLKPWKRAMAIAAMIALLITSSFFIFDNDTITVDTQLAETSNFVLPDNSEVVINAGSAIKYDKEWGDERRLSLDGEAFFKVTKGKTFDVVTKQGTVTVVGTQFNVNERNGLFEVSCFEGKVKVAFKDKVVMLEAGKTVAAIDGTLRDVKNTNQMLPDWLRKESTFKDIPFKQVIKEMERQFDVHIEFNENLSQKSFSGGFGHDNLDRALESVTFPMNLQFKIVNDASVELYDKE